MELDRPIPCTKVAKDVQDQIKHLMQEVAEVYEALYNGDIHNAGLETKDVATSCETLLWLLGFTEDERRQLQVDVNMKNKARGYW